MHVMDDDCSFPFVVQANHMHDVLFLFVVFSFVQSILVLNRANSPAG
jgi:hypothetical protein